MDIDDLRDEIDGLDREIIDRLNARVRLAIEIGRIKQQTGSPVFVPSREERVFEKLVSLSGGPLTEEAIRAIYRQVISVAIAHEGVRVIAFLGPEATYTHQAANDQFGDQQRYLPLASIPDVFAAVAHGDADYGVVPIENSTDGAVGIRSLDLLLEMELKIVAERYLRIHHCLISHTDRTGIRRVYSKDNALGQCRNWLARMMPEAELVPCASTAKAVQLANDEPGAGAIASRIAADIYRVPVQVEGVQDQLDNETRFLVIGGSDKCSPPLGEGRDKTSLVFSLHDKPGALVSALKLFSEEGINLCKIESRPSRERVWDYQFFVDVLGHWEDPEIRAVMDALREHCVAVKWLGSYPRRRRYGHGGERAGGA